MDLADRIAKLCLDKYASIKNTGKPNEKEWTVLSGIVLENHLNELFIISLCTGTKCLGSVELRSTKYEDRGSRLSDSHAEILARRALLRYLYYQIELLLRSNSSDVFYFEKEQIKLKEVSFHFFSSQTPCGDCSIIPKFQENPVDFSILPKKMKKHEQNDFKPIFGFQITDIYRTGAKCIETDTKQDLHGNGVNYHTVGPLRTKPGRGDRTLSLSCSDKIAKWNIMGVQGALLSLMIPVIHLKTIVIGGQCPYSLESMQRGIFKRFGVDGIVPNIIQSKLSFEQRKGGSRIRPCPSSIVWCATPEKSIEIAVEGLKQEKQRINATSQKIDLLYF
ncbi:tRNA-specific adenosine deaminase 1 isoform X2 [Phymastichus coffea]|uniref:tRNA-specific adenosine deaminase 1 isoform X2 n=1 Tax=Phymastichus coffea TaxID=108790 RepID=UPI00273C04AF|nr:tRNA-specific adenosine deaminase 1 isoform X2 [Phymastichus coffea]